MNKIIIISGVTVIAVGSFIYLKSRSSETKTIADEKAPLIQPASEPQTTIPTPGELQNSEPVDVEKDIFSNVIPEPAPLSVETLTEVEQALEEASKEREAAEEALRVVELETEALEAQLDAIELRGDDPADVQGETIDQFQKLFANYQDAILQYEQALDKEEWLQERLDEVQGQ